MPVELVVGVLTDAASVEHHHIGIVGRVGAAHPVGLQQTGDALGVVLVHLAPECAQEVLTAHRTAPMDEPAVARFGWLAERLTGGLADRLTEEPSCLLFSLCECRLGLAAASIVSERSSAREELG